MSILKIEKESVSNNKLMCNLRSMTNTAFKSQNVRKTNKAFVSLGWSQSFFKGWIIYSSTLWHYDY